MVIKISDSSFTDKQIDANIIERTIIVYIHKDELEATKQEILDTITGLKAEVDEKKAATLKAVNDKLALFT